MDFRKTHWKVGSEAPYLFHWVDNTNQTDRLVGLLGPRPMQAPPPPGIWQSAHYKNKVQPCITEGSVPTFLVLEVGDVFAWSNVEATMLHANTLQMSGQPVVPTLR